MKKILLIGMIFITQELMAFESGQLSLDTPNVLEASKGSFGIRHRFFGEADDFEKLLGSDDGGNMHLTLKYALLDNLLLGVNHTRDQSTNGIGLEYAYDLDWVKTGIHLNGYSLNRIGEKEQSYFVNSTVQTKNFFDHLNLTMNYGYDAYYEHHIFGLGFNINVDNFIPWMTFTQKVSLLGEVYPQVDKVEGISKKYDSYAFGLMFETYAHHFELLLSNSFHMDPRTMSLGTDSRDTHFGFNISRKF